MRFRGGLTLFTNIDNAIAAIEAERNATEATLSRLEDAALTVGVAPGVRTIGEVAWHFPRSLESIAGQLGLDLGLELPESPPPSVAVIHEAYSRASRALVAAVGDWTDDVLSESVDVYGEMWTRGHTLRILLDHEIHHRGQLTILMRRAGLEPAPVYGPVARDVPDPFEAADASEPERLDPRVRVAWIIDNLIWSAILCAGGVFAELYWVKDWSWWPLPAWWGVGAMAILFFSSSVVWPFFSYRAWSYVVRTHDVLLAYGVLWRVRRSVPRPRIQHVDVRSGPIDRAFGLSKCTLFTAGTGEADATIPGVVPEVAESLRERLLAGDLYRG